MYNCTPANSRPTPTGLGDMGGTGGPARRIRALRRMRICYHNPQEAASLERLEDISAELHRWDIVLLSGTCTRVGTEAAQRNCSPSHT
eukprot:122131-Pyramimonas_sp.AAC.1